MWKRIVPDEPLDLDAIEARARDWRDYRAGKELVLALIARVREQEQENAELRKRSEAWRAYAEHLVGCVECGQTSPDNCWEGGALRADALGLPRP